MDYQIQLTTVEPHLTAVVRASARLTQLTQVVPQLCGEVWTYMRSTTQPRPGRHLALYLNDVINLEVGAEVSQPFTGDGRVICSKTPGGLVATTVHIGPYNRLGDAHDAIIQWCAKQGHALAGPRWEIYGHWTDDPTQLRTDVYWLLAPGC